MILVGAGGDEYCYECGAQRGLWSEPISKTDTGFTTLVAVEALKFDKAARLLRASGFQFRHKVSLEETRSRAQKADSVQRAFERVYQRAILWLSRDTTIQPDQIASEAATVLELPLSEARQVTADIRAAVYRQQHPRRQTEMPRKLTDEQARECRELYATGEWGQNKLGRRYGITGGHVFNIITGGVYKNAGGPIHIPPRDRWIHEMRAACGLK